MTYIENIEISRELFEHKDNTKNKFSVPKGISENIIKQISEYKKEPNWMTEKRLQSFKIFQELKMPNWGPNLEKLNLNEMCFFVVPDAEHNADKWEKVPKEIKNTFEKLGIPEAERKALSGAGAQYDSQIVYHNLQEELKKQGVIFEDMDIAVQKYPELVKKYFMNKCVSPRLHKFAALHGAVWSGGTFIYVPKNVIIKKPLQAYFRMNSEGTGQFEHTLIIIDEGAECHYIEGCFEKGTLVKTFEGYIPIEEIVSKDIVMTSEGRFKEVKQTKKIIYSGTEYSITLAGDTTQPIIVTENHPFLYVDKKRKNERNKFFNPRWNIPSYFKKGDYLAIPIYQEIDTNNYQTFIIKYKNEIKKKKIEISKEFMRLIGYYLAEGSISRGYYLNFSFNSKEREYIEDVKECLKKVFNIKKINEVHHKTNHGTSVVVSSVELAQIFEQFGKGNDKKHIPSWVLKQQPVLQQELIKTWFFGDGNYHNKKTKNNWIKESFRINTTSKILARQGRDILLRLGIVAFINKTDRSKTGRKIMYTLGVTGGYLKKFGDIVKILVEEKINNKNRASLFGIDNKFAYIPIKKIEKKQVKNKIMYDLEIKDDETYTVQDIAVHNCSAPKYSTNSLHAGCVEIFVHKNARMRYSSIENWSKNTYNLNTKRSNIEENGVMEWVSGNLGSGVTMLYPASVLIGEGARADHIGIAFAGPEQNQDTGSKVYHMAKNTTSTIKSKSISRGGGISTYRGLVKIKNGATNSKCAVNCDALMFDNISQSNTFPKIEVDEKEVDMVHEAKVGKISETQLFYLMSRGLSEEEALQLIVNGFIEPIIKELPLEYAVEMNRLIQLEMDKSLG